MWFEYRSTIGCRASCEHARIAIGAAAGATARGIVHAALDTSVWCVYATQHRDGDSMRCLRPAIAEYASTHGTRIDAGVYAHAHTLRHAGGPPQQHRTDEVIDLDSDG